MVKHGGTITFDKRERMILSVSMSNNELAELIRLSARLIIENNDSRFTVMQILSGLASNLDLQQISSYCEHCKNGYPTMDYQGFKFCPHCGSRLYKKNL
ncbi:hypothetical protein [Liquorilactobacillus mali]|uniref:Uncharacterized protein n=1 Tax=Liquorilactobacillus mali KCTC 3596 = DSM 20444 TaxID=1046596 RepID=A0A0R2DZH4_9LACO|nr:hypothetical protein [Liquorilactobacillus mali]KRN09358.1 hypothetical protein FD00_GL001081 [Liquorilactobacillus mali KCTC 3596 = DSM 20444]